MVEYLVADSLTEANAIITKLNTFAGYPNTRVKTDTYAMPIEHRSQKGKYLIVISEVGAPALDSGTRGNTDYSPGVFNITAIKARFTANERGKIKTDTVLKTEDAFPIPSDA